MEFYYSARPPPSIPRPMNSIYCNWHKNIFTFALLGLSAMKGRGGREIAEETCWSWEGIFTVVIQSNFPMLPSTAYPCLFLFLPFHVSFTSPYHGVSIHILVPHFWSGEILFCPHCWEALRQLSFINGCDFLVRGSVTAAKVETTWFLVTFLLNI